MHSKHLPTRIRQLVALGLASTACSTGAGSSPTIPEDGMTNACVNGAVPLITGLSPSKAVDYLAFRTETRPYYYPLVVDAGTGNTGGTGTAPEGSVSDSPSRGVPCATATDANACRAKLASLRILAAGCKSLGNVAQCSASYLIYTRGDEVGTAATTAEGKAFLGTVDTKEDAFYMAALAGYNTICSNTQNSEYRTVVDGYDLVVFASGCQGAEKYLVRVTTTDGEVTVAAQEKLTDTGTGCAIEGRRPSCLTPSRRASTNPVGDYLARAAHLEAASVLAFRELERELTEHGAPLALVKKARKAREDEIRHARTVTKLARRFGGRVQRARAVKAKPRALFEVALHNAIEGCVRETYGAAMALVRSMRAEDPEVRDAMEAIAEDELGHARLSWEVMEWAETKLSENERTLISRAKKEAVAELLLELNAEPSDALKKIVGLPSAAQARALFANLARDVWQDAA